MPDNDEARDLLIRLDERMLTIQKALYQVETTQSKFVETIRNEYVTKVEFAPVQRAVYAAVGFIVMGMLGGLMTILLKGAH